MWLFEEDRLRFLHLLNMEGLQMHSLAKSRHQNTAAKMKMVICSLGQQCSRLFMDAKSGDLYLYGILCEH